MRQIFLVYLGHRERLWLFVDVFPVFLGFRGSSWNQLGELYPPMISDVDLGVFVGHRLFYKYPFFAICVSSNFFESGTLYSVKNTRIYFLVF
jgi:hypothetical protein